LTTSRRQVKSSPIAQRNLRNENPNGSDLPNWIRKSRRQSNSVRALRM